ncbi:MAG: ATP-dependent RNA helicase DbpA [Gammaproteobacteria bacterium]|nr:ATP-dependent RNA helicase DbpA [Gammaproteobacteria bacterium]
MTQTEPKSFAELSLREALFNNLATLDYTVMTPIQVQSLPFMLKNEDVIAKAKTGSGKTAAFGLSVLNNLNVESYFVQALILCPTRELAEQVSLALRQLARLMPNVKISNLSGGIPMKVQLDSLKHSPHIIVGTPGRVQKHLDKESLSLNNLQTLVLDEADRMLDMGFYNAIKEIISACPKQRQTLLFSATYPDEIKKLAKQFMRHPKEVLIETTQAEYDIEQCFYEVASPANKFAVLKSILLHYKPRSTLIFCNTKQQTTDLTEQLKKMGFSASALNGDMEQAERDLTIVRFTNNSCCILVATDVAARGLDILELPLVINFELAFEPDVHIHRIGRTGRAGNKGLAISLTTPADQLRISMIEDNLIHPIQWGKISGLTTRDTKIPTPEMITLCLAAGKKDKIRPGDILGALTKDAGLPGDMIGKINIATLHSYVAIHHSQIKKAFQYFQNGKLKGRKVTIKNLR